MMYVREKKLEYRRLWHGWLVVRVVETNHYETVTFACDAVEERPCSPVRARHAERLQRRTAHSTGCAPLKPASVASMHG